YGLHHPRIMIFVPDHRKIRELPFRQWLPHMIVKYNSAQYGIVGAPPKIPGRPCFVVECLEEIRIRPHGALLSRGYGFTRLDASDFVRSTITLSGYPRPHALSKSNAIGAEIFLHIAGGSMLQAIIERIFT